MNSKEPRPKPGAPACPKDLGAAEKKVWKAVCAVLSDMDIVTAADASMLERYCLYYVRWRACERFVSENGTTYPILRTPEVSPSGAFLPADFPFVQQRANGDYVIAWVEFPQVRESHRLHKALKDIEDRFALSPAARSRVESLSENGPRLHDADETASKKAKFFG